MTEQASPAKCPWPKQYMRDCVKRAIDDCGGRRGFEFIGRAMQEKVIDAMLFGMFQTAAQFAKQGITFADMVGARTVAYEIAGISTED